MSSEELAPARIMMQLTRWQRAGYDDAETEWEESAGEPGGTCGVLITRGVIAGRRCPRMAGQGTVHLGAGRCVAHGGAKSRGRAAGAWLMAHRFGQELDCSPWEGLLRAVRIAAGKSAYCEFVLGQATDDLELEGRFGRSEEGILLHPDTGEPLGGGEMRNLSWWVDKSEVWSDRLARYSKMAVDAGVAERLVAQVEAEGAAIGRVLEAVIDELGDDAPIELVGRLRARMRRELLAIESEETAAGVIEGTATEVPNN